MVEEVWEFVVVSDTEDKTEHANAWKKVLKHLTYANVLATITAFAVCGGMLQDRSGAKKTSQEYQELMYPKWKIITNRDSIIFEKLTNDLEVNELRAFYYHHQSDRVKQVDLPSRKGTLDIKEPYGIVHDFQRIAYKIQYLRNDNKSSPKDILIDSLNPYVLESSLPVIIETSFMVGPDKRTTRAIYKLVIRNQYRRTDGLTTSITKVAPKTEFADFSIHEYLQSDAVPEAILMSLLREHGKLGKDEIIKSTLLNHKVN